MHRRDKDLAARINAIRTKSQKQCHDTDDNGDIVDTLFIDFHKAFDLVEHLLIRESSIIISFNRFKPYLSTRLQAIMSEQGLSEFAHILLDFSLHVKAATLIFISGCGLAISSAKEGKSGFIYNLVKS